VPHLVRHQDGEQRNRKWQSAQQLHGVRDRLAEAREHSQDVVFQEDRTVPVEVIGQASAYGGGGKERKEKQDRVKPVTLTRPARLFTGLG
jgi:hypothetical protein